MSVSDAQFAALKRYRLSCKPGKFCVRAKMHSLHVLRETRWADVEIACSEESSQHSHRQCRRGGRLTADELHSIQATAQITYTHEEAVSDVDVVILAIPFGKHSELATLLSKAPANATVIDTSNYYPFRDGSIADVEHGKPESVWASEQVGRPLIKAWNAVLAATLADKG
ncbi:NADPH-dependent F420 reductase [Dickeya chrysanthemi]|uniref:NADPH-dependent F420 reductase n=1 Tax=Dickeya chrysanthemi TaxID=556 RepID=UPI0003A3FB52|nr:NAD(P)-binding domain-containing protein [Dickeya chrysanthemi]